MHPLPLYLARVKPEAGAGIRERTETEIFHAQLSTLYSRSNSNSMNEPDTLAIGICLQLPLSLSQTKNKYASPEKSSLA